MKVILTDDVVGVGDIGQEVKVRGGFARNFLIPRGLAMETGSASARQIAHKMRQIEAKKKRQCVAATELGEKLKRLNIQLELRVGTGGKVFGSINAKDIAESIRSAGIEVDRRRILLSEPIRKVGDLSVNVKLHPEVIIELGLKIKGVAASRQEQLEEVNEAKALVEESVVDDDEVDEFGSEGDYLS